MQVTIYSNGAHQTEPARVMAAGFAAHGINATISSPRQVVPCDLAVVWGMRQDPVIGAQRRIGGHFLVMERAYIGDRFHWISLGFDGLNGRARFPKIDDNLQRWNKHFAPLLKPWARTIGLTAVIMGQVRGDVSCRHIDFPKWVGEKNAALKAKGYNPYLRLHPGDQKLHVPGVAEINGSLEETLGKAELVVTYNSNSGVDAVMAGVPVYAEDPGSMVYTLSSKDYKPNMGDRTNWQKYMAYTQWLPEEIERGEAWEALRTVKLG